MKRGMFRATGTTNAALTFIHEVMQVICESLSYTCDATGTLKFYRAKQKAAANAADAGTTTLVIKTDTLGKVGGAVLTTSDYVIVADSSGTGWQLRSISNVAAVASSTVTLTLGAAATCAANDMIYIVRAADIHSLVTGNETKLNLLNLFNSYPNMPVAVELNGSTGTKYLSGTYRVE